MAPSRTGCCLPARFIPLAEIGLIADIANGVATACAHSQTGLGVASRLKVAVNVSNRISIVAFLPGIRHALQAWIGSFPLIIEITESVLMTSRGVLALLPVKVLGSTCRATDFGDRILSLFPQAVPRR